jgi:hypothetical protein
MHRKVLFLRDGEDGGGNVLWFAARIAQTEDASGQLVLIQTIDLYYSEHNKLQ